MSKPVDVDSYLAALPEQTRAALERLRAAIKAAAPNATETISYEIPTYKHNGRMLMSFAAFKDHCSIFPIGEGIVDGLKGELEGRAKRFGKATLRFSPTKPLPAALVRRLVKARMAEADAARQRVSKRR